MDGLSTFNAVILCLASPLGMHDCDVLDANGSRERHSRFRFLNGQQK
jgi:hypothetical protein